MLVTVVLVFLVCHSVKLIINGYEVYYLMSDNFAATAAGMAHNATSVAAAAEEGGSEAYDDEAYMELGSGDDGYDGGSGSGQVSP